MKSPPTFNTFENVLVPANVWAPVVTIPEIVALADGNVALVPALLLITGPLVVPFVTDKSTTDNAPMSPRSCSGVRVTNVLAVVDGSVINTGIWVDVVVVALDFKVSVPVVVLPVESATEKLSAFIPPFNVVEPVTTSVPVNEVALESDTFNVPPMIVFPVTSNARPIVVFPLTSKLPLKSKF